MMISDRQNNANKAVELYTLAAKESEKRFPEEYLTFCPFEEKVPGFSMSRVSMNPEKYQAEMELVKAKQIEMRQVLFCKEDFERIRALFDIGCGLGTDVIQIAALYPHIQTHGFTITKAQADLGNQRIAQMNLGSQAMIFNKNSAKDPFPGRYDIIIGIEVTFHIRDKHGLFKNISSALNEDGKVLLMDYISNFQGRIADLTIEATVPTERDWIDIVSMHSLVIDEIIDVSQEIANYLYDPGWDENTKNLPHVARDLFRNCASQSKFLEEGYFNYCLLILRKDTKRSFLDRRNYNADRIANKIPYPEAREEMLQRGHVPYPNPEKLRRCRAERDTMRNL